MSVKTVAQLKVLTDQVIKTNGNEEITATLDNALRKHVLDSYLNLATGGLAVQTESGYSSAITPSSDYAFATKKYVDDNSGLTNTLASGKIFVGNVSNVATAQTPSGVVSMSNTGVFSFPNERIRTDGGSVATTGNIQMGNALGLEWAGSASITANSGQLVLTGGTGYFNISSSSLYFYTGSAFGSLLDTNNLTADHYNQMPDRDGILATLDDIPSLTGYLSNTLASGSIFVGSAGNVATAATLSLSGSAGSFELSNAGVLTMPDAAAGTRGLLNSTDWNTFNGKQAALSGTGFVKISGTTISYDNSTYLTGNQTITLSGDISGSGSTAITTAIGAGKVTNTMLAGSIAYSKLSLTGSIVNADITNGTIDLTTKVTGILPGTNGGTGVNNSTRTMTYAGNVAFTGAFNATFAVPLTATWTLPTPASGTASTLAALNTAQTFTSLQTFTASVQASTLQILDNDGVTWKTAAASTINNTLIFGTGFTGMRISKNTTPTADNTIDLGSSALRWKNTYGNNYFGSSYSLMDTTDKVAMEVFTANELRVGNGFSGGTKIMTKFGFGVTPAAQATGGAATATIAYTATEQGMLQKAYDALRTFGFLS